MFGGKKQGLL